MFLLVQTDLLTLTFELHRALEDEHSVRINREQRVIYRDARTSIVRVD